MTWYLDELFDAESTLKNFDDSAVVDEEASVGQKLDPVLGKNIR
jgi:hypothetical protein